MLKTDILGFQYYKELPDNARPCKDIWTFVTLDPEEWSYYKLNIGMKYLVYGYLSKRYELYEITKWTKDIDLLKYIESGQLFVFEEEIIDK
jgi:hypothetical protein